MTSTDFQGVDASWLAVDSMGRIAVFTTGGEGAIPLSALPSALDAEEMLQSLEDVSDWTLVVDLPRPDDFVAFAKRGLFSYDWSDVHRTNHEALGCYELQASPVQPLSIEQLPEKLRSLAKATTLTLVTFGARYVNLHL